MYNNGQTIEELEGILANREYWDHISGDFLNETYMGSLYHMYRYDHALFLKYQSHQATENFNTVEYIVSFIGESGQEARFVGVFKNCGHETRDEKPQCLIFKKSKDSRY